MDFKILDGAMGTELIKTGIKGETSVVNITNPEVITKIHLSYAKAGATIITANTFGAYKHKFENANEQIKAALSCANKIKEVYNIEVALDIGATGLLLEPYGDTTEEECLDIFTSACETGAANDADLIIIETMMDINEMSLALQAATKTGLPIIATMSFNENGKTMYGVSLEDMAEELTHPNIISIGMNCGFGPDIYLTLVENLKSLTNKPLTIQPNAGIPIINSNGETEYPLSPDEFAKTMYEAYKKEVKYLGGCCGTTPEHIKALTQKF